MSDTSRAANQSGGVFLKVKHLGRRKVNRSLGGNLVLFRFLFLMGCFMILPFVYSVLQSVKPVEEIFVFPPRFFVRRPTADNYTQLFRLANSLWVPFGRYLLNSVLISVAVTLLHVLVSSMAGFALAKYRFPLSRALFEIVVVALLFTGDVINVMRYLVLAKLHIIDTVWALLLPSIAAPLGLFLMTQFMKKLPTSLLEAAEIDGASTYRILIHVVMPNVKPAWLTLIIFCFQNVWNMTGGNYIYSEQLKLLPTVLNQVSSGGIARAGVGAAAAVILMAVPIVLFLFAQGSIMETMAESGIKE